MIQAADFAADAQIETVPAGLMAEPLDWFFAEHYRHRQLCRLVERLARSDVFDGACLATVIAFLRHDLPLHVLDEEEDLFPLLRRRAAPEDDIERILGMLTDDHGGDRDRVGHLLRGLEKAGAEGMPPSREAGLRALLLEFVALERRHVALENAIVIPIARLRLKPQDLQDLSHRMAARRRSVAHPD